LNNCRSLKEFDEWEKLVKGINHRNDRVTDGAFRHLRGVVAKQEAADKIKKSQEAAAQLKESTGSKDMSEQDFNLASLLASPAFTNPKFIAAMARVAKNFTK
jgi:hypothetical protein